MGNSALVPRRLNPAPQVAELIAGEIKNCPLEEAACVVSPVLTILALFGRKKSLVFLAQQRKRKQSLGTFFKGEEISHLPEPKQGLPEDPPPGYQTKDSL